jgi:hypothetical protein
MREGDLLLRSPTVGEWFSEDPTVTIAGLGHRLKLDRISLVSAQAKGENGLATECNWGTTPDSKYGPVAFLRIRTAKASGSISLDARIKYAEAIFVLKAKFLQSPSGSWEAAEVRIEKSS